MNRLAIALLTGAFVVAGAAAPVYAQSPAPAMKASASAMKPMAKKPMAKKMAKKPMAKKSPAPKK